VDTKKAADSAAFVTPDMLEPVVAVVRRGAGLKTCSYVFRSPLPLGEG
jgi:hypothetical protein